MIFLLTALLSLLTFSAQASSQCRDACEKLKMYTQKRDYNITNVIRDFYMACPHEAGWSRSKPCLTKPCEECLEDVTCYHAFSQ